VSEKATCVGTAESKEGRKSDVECRFLLGYPVNALLKVNGEPKACLQAF